MDEHIYFVTREHARQHAWLGHGFCPDPEHDFYQALQQGLALGPRAPLEEDPSKKQIIPYVVIGCRDGIWTMRRKRKQTETRLHDKISIGVGGHIDDIDAHAEETDLIQAGMLRELKEEVHLDLSTSEPLYRGVINDDTTLVGQVHMGVVYTLTTPNKDGVRIRETDKLEGFWSSFEQLETQEAQMESWSAFLLPHIRDWF